MTDEEEEQAAAYLKLHDNVNGLIIKAITNELITNPSGTLAMQIGYIAKHNMQEDLRQYRVVKVGTIANY